MICQTRMNLHGSAVSLQCECNSWFGCDCLLHLSRFPFLCRSCEAGRITHNVSLTQNQTQPWGIPYFPAHHRPTSIFLPDTPLTLVFIKTHTRCPQLSLIPSPFLSGIHRWNVKWDQVWHGWTVIMSFRSGKSATGNNPLFFQASLFVCAALVKVQY